MSKHLIEIPRRNIVMMVKSTSSVWLWGYGWVKNAILITMPAPVSANNIMKLNITRMMNEVVSFGST